MKKLYRVLLAAPALAAGPDREGPIATLTQGASYVGQQLRLP